MAEDFLLAVPDAGGGGVQTLRHRTGGVEQEFTLLGENQSSGMSVKEGGVEALLQRANLPGYRRLAEMKGVTGMRQAPGVRHGVKYS